jgi:3-hydroxyacyl-CoA dehydrogenase
MGPFETWDAIGLAKSVKKMEQTGFAVPETVKKMIDSGHASFYKNENGKRFYYDFSSQSYKEVVVSKNIVSLPSLKGNNQTVKTCPSASLVDLGDDVFCLEFHTKMNALNGEIVDFMASAIDFIDQNGAGLVIGNQAGGMPGAFSAGGDLAYMGQLAKEGKFSEIDSFLQTAQAGMQKTRYSNFPVVAAPYGLTLGGGCEVCI